MRSLNPRKAPEIVFRGYQRQSSWDSKLLPVSYGGASGGGLWRVQLIRSKEGDIQYKAPVLYGVVFYQTNIQESMRYIRCHGPHSVYERVFEVINDKCNQQP